MRLSERVNSIKPSTTLAVDAKVKAMRAQGVNVIGFGAGEPDFDTPANIKHAAIDALNAGKTKYAATEGDPAARQAIAAKLKRDNNINCDPSGSDIVISNGAKHSIYLALQCLLDPNKNQQVILPTPAWVSYRPMIELAGGEVVEVAGAIDNDFKITPAQLAKAITARTVGFVINTPSNPCGTMYSPEELRALGEVLIKHENVAIIADEIYEKLIYSDVKHFSLGSISELAQRTITVNGLSKAYAMTGWRVGYACSPGEGAKVIKAMAKLQGQMTSNITTFIYPAIVEALTNGGPSIEKMRQKFAHRAALLYDRISAMPGLKCAVPTGAFYVFPDVSAYFGTTSRGGRKIDSAYVFAESLLEDANVAVVPGEDFGACAANHVRLSFACSEQNINEGCDRIEHWLRQLHSARVPQATHA